MPFLDISDFSVSQYYYIYQMTIICQIIDLYQNHWMNPETQKASKAAQLPEKLMAIYYSYIQDEQNIRQQFQEKFSELFQKTLMLADKISQSSINEEGAYERLIYLSRYIIQKDQKLNVILTEESDEKHVNGEVMNQYKHENFK